jgi:formylglycine-generating enzyme required for sulfatase activity
MDKQHQLDQLFTTAKAEQPHYSFDDTKEKFLSTVIENPSMTKAKKTSFLSTKTWIIMLTTISTLTAVLVFFFSVNSTKNVPKLSAKQISESKQELAETNSTTGVNSVPEKNPSEKYAFILPEIASSMENPFKAPFENPLFFPEPLEQPMPKPTIFDDTYVFPKLTEEEIKANHKQKKTMLKALEKMDKKSYTFLVSGSFDFKGKMTSVQSFLIQNTEISNLEYRTFLFDLLIQDRKDEFLKARPDQNQWSLLPGGQNNKMKDHYFSHPAYDHFPVVNISREGAEMYCKWLTQELFKVVDEKKKNQFNDIRLPVREEWVMAASIEGKKGPYPWDGEFTRNSDGLYLANYKRKLLASDSIATAIYRDITAPVESYWPNDFGLYNMSGNVAEMVYDDIKTKSAGTAGGGWMNNEEEIKILGPDPYTGVTNAHPGIGFRVVMTIRLNVK